MEDERTKGRRGNEWREEKRKGRERRKIKKEVGRNLGKARKRKNETRKEKMK